MQDTLSTLWRLQKYRKRQARLELVEAEAVQAGAEQRIESLQTDLNSSRQRDEEFDALDLAQEHAWRLHLHLRQRREEGVAAAAVREVENRRTVLEDEVRKAEVYTKLLERRAERLAKEERRSEAKNQDDETAGRWVRMGS